MNGGHREISTLRQSPFDKPVLSPFVLRQAQYERVEGLRANGINQRFLNLDGKHRIYSTAVARFARLCPSRSEKVAPMNSPVTETMVYDALKKVIDPELRHNIVELGFIQEIDIVDDYVHLEIQLTTPNCPYADTIVAQIKSAVEGVQGVKRVEVERACMKEL
jgi:metal-sulfur cluster biosynthetic enzyme